MTLSKAKKEVIIIRGMREQFNKCQKSFSRRAEGREKNGMRMTLIVETFFNACDRGKVDKSKKAFE